MRIWIMACTLAVCWPFVHTTRAAVDEAVLEAEQQRIAVVDRARQAAIAIFARGGQGGGSGVVISPDGYALSNFHVTKPAGTAMKCGMPDGGLYDAVIVGLDPTGDVALLKLLGRDDFPHAELGDSDGVRPGDECFAVGNPFLLATDFQPTVTYGIVSGTHRYQYPAGTLLEYADCIQTDASINPGNSGGPLFDAHGKLIGINGRGSFEKRGRVNVGVGYAISINQIKNFLGCLESGRIVDHATLGARVGTDSDGRVLVRDILDTSDAYRRGLRYGDEIVRFAGRRIRTANALTNALGIFPKGWRLALEYRRDGELYDMLVRLEGVHRSGELIDAVEGRGPSQPPPGPPPRPDGPAPDDETRPPAPTANDDLPAVVKEHFEARAGYANYFFNKLHRQRVWKAHTDRADFSGVRGAWTITGQLPGGGEITFELGDQFCTVNTPAVNAELEITDDLRDSLQPPGSGGMLTALALWRRLLTGGPERFGDVYYYGTAPLPERGQLADVLIGAFAAVECHFAFQPETGELLAVEMFAREDADPCEIYFYDYREVDGRYLPHQVEVRHGDDVYATFQWTAFELTPSPGPQS